VEKSFVGLFFKFGKLVGINYENVSEGVIGCAIITFYRSE
jgi:hypothetical protein